MLKMTITPTASTASPAIRNVVMHYHQRYPQRREWDINILAEQNLIGANGRIDGRSVNKIIADLNTARVNHKQVTLLDALENTSQVYVNEVAQTIKILKGNRSPSFIVPLKLIEATVGNKWHSYRYWIIGFPLKYTALSRYPIVVSLMLRLLSRLH
jgi:hypothetical protein